MHMRVLIVMSDRTGAGPGSNLPPMADDARAEVVLGGRVLESAGLSDMAWGHVSARDPEGRGAWMKAAGQGFDEVTEATVPLVDPEGEVLAGEGARDSEHPIHTPPRSARPGRCCWSATGSSPSARASASP